MIGKLILVVIMLGKYVYGNPTPDSLPAQSEPTLHMCAINKHRLYTCCCLDYTGYETISCGPLPKTLTANFWHHKPAMSRLKLPTKFGDIRCSHSRAMVGQTDRHTHKGLYIQRYQT